MKNIKMINLKKIKKASCALIVLFLASCLKDTGPVQDYSQTPTLLSFQFKGGSAFAVTASLPLGNDDPFPVEVTMSTPSVTLGSTVSGTVAADQKSLDDYNSENGTNYTLVGSDKYTIDNNGTVTFKPGDHIITTVIHFNANAIDFSAEPALALKITPTTSGVVAASNLNVMIIPLKLKNAYDADYDVTGYFVHPTAPRAIDMTKTILTVSPIRSITDLGDLGASGYQFEFDVDASNNVNNWAAAGATPAASGFINGVDNPAGSSTYPGAPYVHTTYNNTYDPANTTFWMHYGYNPGYTREVYEKWVRQ